MKIPWRVVGRVIYRLLKSLGAENWSKKQGPQA